ncbi:MAG: hypothetical protein ACTHKM_10425 [Tsuneonella sp.]
MSRAWLLGGAALVLCSAIAAAQSAPESLLPPGFEEPTPAPTRTAAPRPSGEPSAAPSVNPTSHAVIQPLPPSAGETVPSAEPATPVALPSGLPSLDALEKMSTDDLDELLGLKPKVDIPPGARRSLQQVGVIGPTEGGMPTGSLINQPASLVRAALAGTKGPLVSRWGHILLRRALASRLDAPTGMDPVEFAALRASVLDSMGEWSAARALVQDVDTANWSPQLTSAALNAYIGTTDIAGACPAVRLQGGVREDGTWRLFQGICNAYAGEGARARTDLNRLRSRGTAAPIDVALAQRFAGAAGGGRGGVTVDWNGVDDLTPLRYALALAVGEAVPDSLTSDLGAYYQRVSATAPALGLADRAAGADRAAREGILSSAAYIDLYGLIRADGGIDGPAADTADQLREAYVGKDPAARLAAIKSVWGGGEPDYARAVLTAYAAARMAPSKQFAGDAPTLIASMLSAGLERDAMRWAQFAPEGSEAWALLTFADPNVRGTVSSNGVGSFIDDDNSAGKRKAKFLVAGLAGLGRIGSTALGGLESRSGANLGQPTKWTRLIDQAAAVDNQALVALLAGVGMQGTSWKQMTPRHLFHIVRALDQVGMTAEARMIAAEAVARA